MHELTAEENAVYDRQLRVWGVETQSKLSAARVLVIGCSGVAAELCKNLTLAGVGSLTLVDDTPCARAPKGNFLVPCDSPPAASVASCVAATLGEMNPFVSVRALPSPPHPLPASFLRGAYDVLVLSASPAQHAEAANAACREVGCAFLLACVRAEHGFFFADLGDAHLARPPAARAAPEAPAKEAVPPAARVMAYVPLATALAAPPGDLPKTTSLGYLLLRAAAEVERVTGAPLAAGDADALRRAGAALRAGCPAMLGAALTDEALDAYAAGAELEMPPISAVVGGVLANDVLKALSGVGEPAHNFFLFDSHTCAGTLDRVACPV